MNPEQPPSSDANSLLHQLIKVNLPTGLDPHIVTQYFSYFSRALSSDLSPQYSKNEEQIRLSMNNHIDEGDSRDKGSSKQRLQQLLEKLSRKNVNLTRRSSVLRLLYRVAISKKDDNNYIGSGTLFQMTNLNKYSPSNTQQVGSYTNGFSRTHNSSKMEEESLPPRSSFLAKRRPENPIRNSSHNELQKSIVRELIFMFQGVKSNHFAHDYETGRFVVNSNLDLRICDKKMILILCELGWLYNGI